MAEFNQTSSDSDAQYREKRSVPRFVFIATMLLIEPVSDAQIPGRISEISRKGCYVDALNTLPVGTPIRIDISRDQGAFTTTARIIYVQDGIGMGVAFVDTPEDQLATLDSWLAELSG